MTLLNEVAIGVGIFLALVVLAKLSAISARVDALSRLDDKLDLLLKQAGIEFQAHKDAPDDVEAALRRGQKILAIKLYREATGVGLKEAKDYVESIERGLGRSS